VLFNTIGIEPVGMSRDVAEKVQPVGGESGAIRSGFNRAIAHAPRLADSAKQPVRPPHGVVAPADIACVTARCERFDEPLRRLIRLAELGQHPGGAADRRARHGDISRPKHGKRVLKQRPRGIDRPSAFAALRLITSSNFVGCSTGRSAGFAPLRIFLSQNTARWSATRRD